MQKEINVVRLFALVMIGVIVAGSCILWIVNSRVDYDELTEIKITTRGTMVPTKHEYALRLENGTWVATYTITKWHQDDVRKAVVDASFANDLIQILKDSKAHRWDNFDLGYEIEKLISEYIFDGAYYGFYLSFSDGTVIENEEYEAYPKNYHAVLGAFEERYEALFGE